MFNEIFFFTYLNSKEWRSTSSRDKGAFRNQRPVPYKIVVLLAGWLLNRRAFTATAHVLLFGLIPLFDLPLFLSATVGLLTAILSSIAAVVGTKFAKHFALAPNWKNTRISLCKSVQLYNIHNCHTSAAQLSQARSVWERQCEVLSVLLSGYQGKAFKTSKPKEDWKVGSEWISIFFIE